MTIYYPVYSTPSKIEQLKTSETACPMNPSKAQSLKLLQGLVHSRFATRMLGVAHDLDAIMS